jgi:hypothetical protein
MSTTLPAVHGRINVLDSHLQVPISRWTEVFGEATARFGEQFAGIALFDATDEPDLTTESVWRTKGTAAPGASTPEGRLAAMDVMGIERQLIFPQVVLAGHEPSSARRGLSAASIFCCFAWHKIWWTACHATDI